MDRTVSRTFRFVVAATVSTVGLALAVLLSTGQVLADNGPHSSAISATADTCAACHRTHSGSASRLLRASDSRALCTTCHSGVGADTDVTDGLYLPSGAGLRGGGFVAAKMDTAVTGSATTAPVTSSHSVDSSSHVAWGYGAINATAEYGADVALTCTNCHNPHGDGQYRILKREPNSSYGTGSVSLPDEPTKQYQVSYGTDNFRDTSYVPPEVSRWCAQCHTRYLAGSGSGSTDSDDAVYEFRHMTGNLSGGCLRCHVAHGTAATMQTTSGQAPWPDGSAGSGLNDSRLLNVNNRGVCAQCHIANGRVVGGCNGCHGAPPATGAHLAHAGTGAVGYGLTGSHATSTSYQYGCGECHPTDQSKHMNGVVDIALSSTGAPPASLKARNAVSATYAGGTCSGVYCHGGPQITSGAVGLPLEDGSSQLILDSHSNLTYAAYDVTMSRSYVATPAWSGGNISSCSSCHAFPLTTSYPSVQAGVGDSHQWIDDYGYGDLHAWNMAFDPVSCRTCHYGEITVDGTWSRNGMDVTTYNSTLLADRTNHANGRADVAFDTVNPVTYPASGGTVTYSLASAAYVSGEKACTNVACHQFQTYVRWASPYRWWNSPECDLCHRKSLPKPGPLSLSAADPGTADAIHAPGNISGKECSTCHQTVHRAR